MFGTTSQQAMTLATLAAERDAHGRAFETAERKIFSNETLPALRTESKLRRRLRRKHELGMSGSF